jgi:hypothetical protein
VRGSSHLSEKSLFLFIDPELNHAILIILEIAFAAPVAATFPGEEKA